MGGEREIGGGHYYVFILVSLPRRLAPPSVFSYRFSLIFLKSQFSFLFFFLFLFIYLFFSPPPPLSLQVKREAIHFAGMAVCRSFSISLSSVSHFFIFRFSSCSLSPPPFFLRQVSSFPDRSSVCVSRLRSRPPDQSDPLKSLKGWRMGFLKIYIFYRDGPK